MEENVFFYFIDGKKKEPQIMLHFPSGARVTE